MRSPVAGLVLCLLFAAVYYSSAATLWTQNWGDGVDAWISTYSSSDPTSQANSQLLASQFTITDTAWNIAAIKVKGGGPTGPIDSIVRFYNDASGSVGTKIVTLNDNNASCLFEGAGQPTICTIELYSTGGTYTLDTGTYWVSWATDDSPPTWYVTTTDDDDDQGGDTSTNIAGFCGSDLTSCTTPNLTPGAGWTATGKFPIVKISGTVSSYSRAALLEDTPRTPKKKAAAAEPKKDDAATKKKAASKKAGGKEEL